MGTPWENKGVVGKKEITPGTMPGACRRGRPHTAWMDNIKMWTGLPVEESVRMTENRDKWGKYFHGVANPQIEHSYLWMKWTRTWTRLMVNCRTAIDDYETRQYTDDQYSCPWLVPHHDAFNLFSVMWCQLETTAQNVPAPMIVLVMWTTFLRQWVTQQLLTYIHDCSLSALTAQR